MQEASEYPVRFSVDYPDRALNKVSTFFRLFAAIPIVIVLAAISGGGGLGGDYSNDAGSSMAIGGTGILFLGPLLMILFRRKYPRWWFDWNLEIMRFTNRVGAYLLLMNDHYPSTDEQQSVHFEMAYPDVPQQLNRWLPLVKWLLALPHYLVLIFLWFAALGAVIFAWFAILFTGRYPHDLFTFVEGVVRWGNRVIAYAILLTTDRYPPFSLD
jgi:hypothetical protein